MNNETFQLMLTYCEKEKGRFLAKISSSVASVVHIEQDGNIRLADQRLQLELTDHATIGGLADMSEDLVKLLYIVKQKLQIHLLLISKFHLKVHGCQCREYKSV